ncbi:MAG TPA: DUF58 domain-containing protein [Deltaproteobacteria bacterium]|nr:DUF58 domain-containing protein [Deltaproteobacteria bacterium]
MLPHAEAAPGQMRRAAWPWRWLGVPTGALVASSLVPLIVSLGVLASPVVAIPVLALDLVLLALALVDLVMVGGRVRVWRSFAPVQAVGRPFEVVLRIQNVGTRPVQIRFTDDAPGQPSGLPAAASLAVGTEAYGRYRLEIDRRGQHLFGDVVVRRRSPLGLWERQERFEVPGIVRVYPDFARLRELGMRGRLSEERVPVRSRRRPGGENEFQRLRPYVPGDPYRHIDWKATARRREHTTREFGQESNQNLIFLLDSGRMMSAHSGALTAFDHALNAAILLGQAALGHGDRVGLLAFDRSPRVWLAPRAGKRSAGRLIRATYDLFPSLEEPDYAMAFCYLTQRVRRRSLVVLLTSVIDDVNAQLATQLIQGLSSRHLPVAVWIRDVQLDRQLLQPTEGPMDPYVRAAAAELHGRRDQALAGLRQRGALVVDATPAELTSRLLHHYLEIKSRRLL